MNIFPFKCHQIEEVLAEQNVTEDDIITEKIFPSVCPGLYALLIKESHKDIPADDDDDHKEKISQSQGTSLII